MAQVVDLLPSNREALCSNTSAAKANKQTKMSHRKLWTHRYKTHFN
jgi:hypothetical protein